MTMTKFASTLCYLLIYFT